MYKAEDKKQSFCQHVCGVLWIKRSLIHTRNYALITPQNSLLFVCPVIHSREVNEIRQFQSLYVDNLRLNR